MSLAYDWVHFPEGRGRFCGLVRGADDYGHDVYAVDHAGRTAYGEMERTFDGDAVSSKIISYGYDNAESVGMPDAAAAFSSRDAAAIERIVRRLIAVVGARPNGSDRPGILRTTTFAGLTGVITFRAGWIVVDTSPDSPRSEQ